MLEVMSEFDRKTNTDLPPMWPQVVTKTGTYAEELRQMQQSVLEQGEEGRPWLVYALADPIGNIRYIGKTCRSLKQRIQAHKSDALRGRRGELIYNHRNNWLRSVYNSGRHPIVSIVECGVGSSWVESETYWIKFFRDAGCRLVNNTNGGEGTTGAVISEEGLHNKREAARARRGVKLSPEHVANISAALKGKPKTEEERRKSSIALQKYFDGLSEEQRLALPRYWKGKGMNPNSVEPLLIAKLGKPLTDEHKAKISKGNKGKVVSDESRERMKIAQIEWHKNNKKPSGRLHTQETKEKMRASALAWRERKRQAALLEDRVILEARQ